MNIERTIELKNRLIACLPEGNRDQVERSFDNVSDKRFTPSFYYLLSIALLLSVFMLFIHDAILLISAVILLISAVSSIRKEQTIINEKLEVIAVAVAEYYCKPKLKSLDKDIKGYPLRSLRNATWHASYSVFFPDFENRYFSYYSGRNSSFYSGSPHTKSGQHYESKAEVKVSDGVYVQFSHFSTSFKCDFRVIRTPMTVSEVAELFWLISLTLEGISADSITLSQYSSTKHYQFDKEYLDSGTIAYINNRSRSHRVNRDKTIGLTRYSEGGQIEKDKNRMQSTVLSQQTSKKEPEVLKTKKSEVNATPVPVNRKRKTSSILLEELLAKRRMTEQMAINTVMEYERQEGRQPEDVSSANMGYDIISKGSNESIRRIEVKGLGGTGDVILTENEVNVSQELPNEWYLYIVDNCFGENEKTLYIRKGLELEDLTQYPAEYEISLEEQSRLGGYGHFL